MPPPGWVVKAGQPGGGGGLDGEAGGGRLQHGRAAPAGDHRGGGAGLAHGQALRAGAVDLEVGEGRDAAAGGHPDAASERRAAPEAGAAQGVGVGAVGDQVAGHIEDADRRLGGERRPGHRAGRRRPPGELRGHAVDDAEAAGGGDQGAGAAAGAGVGLDGPQGEAAAGQVPAEASGGEVGDAEDHGQGGGAG